MRKSIFFLAAACFLVDRITKAWALATYQEPCNINSFLSFHLTYNRGVSFGLLSSENPSLSLLIFCIIACATLCLALYTWKQYKAHKQITGELLVLVGSFSNMLDRCLYGSVIDFIILTYNQWSFPVFNIADICIVVGVGIMALCFQE